MKKLLSSTPIKVVAIFVLAVVGIGLTLLSVTLLSGKSLFAQNIGGMNEEDVKLYAEAVGELPAMAKVEAQPSPYGEDQALNFAPVFSNGAGSCEEEQKGSSIPGILFSCIPPFERGYWLGDVPAGQTVLIVEIEGNVEYCRVLGVSLQGWDVDGWMRCDRLGPVE